MARFELDAIDRKILAILQVNGRLSNQDIADQVSLSPSPCLRRIRQLEEAGVIRGYVALLEPRLLGLGLLAYVNVRLEKRGGTAPSAGMKNPPTHSDQFREALLTWPEVVACDA